MVFVREIERNGVLNGSFRGSIHCVGYDIYTLKIYIFQRKTGILMT